MGAGPKTIRGVVWFPIIAEHARIFRSLAAQVSERTGLPQCFLCPSVSGRLALENMVCTYLPDVLARCTTSCQQDDQLIRSLDRADRLRLRVARINGQAWKADTPSYLLELGRRSLYYFRQVLDPAQVVALILWNGHTLAQELAAHVARNRGITVSFIEKAPAPGMIIVDIDETSTEIPRRFERSQDFLPSTCNSQLRSRYYVRMKVNGLMTRAYFHAKLRYKMALESLLFRRSLAYDTYSLPPTTHLIRAFKRHLVKEKRLPGGPVLLFPLQMRGDTQNAIYARRLLRGHIRTVVLSMARLNSIFGRKCQLLIRQHPRENDPFLYRHLRRWLSQFDFVVWTTGRRASIVESLSMCSAVCTVNSSVGFEAVRTGLPVITLGHAFYNVKGVTYQASDPEEVFNTLKSVLYTEDARPLTRQTAFVEYCEREEFLPYAQDFRMEESVLTRFLDRAKICSSGR